MSIRRRSTSTAAPSPSVTSIGTSGARITLHAALELARKGSGYAVAALCGAGGQGDALILRRP